MNPIKLSLCVPIYGVEKEIPRFLQSLEQNLREDVEVLLIDDGTKDNSGKIADAFAKRYARYVQVIHKTNGGVSSARNTGLELARGEYVIFPDPDDYLAEDYTAKIIEMIEKYNNPDMIFFDYFVGKSVDNMKRRTISSWQEGFIDKRGFIQEFVKDQDIKGYVWNKAIKQSFYGGRKFNSQTRVGEDYEILTDMVVEMDSFVYLQVPLYYYMLRTNSLTRTARIEDDLALSRLIAMRYQLYTRLYGKMSKCSMLNNAIRVVCKGYEEDGVDVTLFVRMIRDNIIEILTGQDYRMNDKKRALLIYLGLARRYYQHKKNVK